MGGAQEEVTDEGTQWWPCGVTTGDVVWSGDTVVALGCHRGEHWAMLRTLVAVGCHHCEHGAVLRTLVAVGCHHWTQGLGGDPGTLVGTCPVARARWPWLFPAINHR